MAPRLTANDGRQRHRLAGAARQLRMGIVVHLMVTGVGFQTPDTRNPTPVEKCTDARLFNPCSTLPSRSARRQGPERFVGDCALSDGRRPRYYALARSSDLRSQEAE